MLLSLAPVPPRLITAPTIPVATTSEVETMLGIAAGSQPSLAAMIEAVTATLDPASAGWLGRALRPQTWELRLSGFPCKPIRLPYPPVTVVTSVKYDDANGIEQTLVENTDYRVFGLSDAWKTTIEPPYNGTWPSARCDTESVRIRYTSGYALTPADLMPASVKAAVSLGVRQLTTMSEQDASLVEEEVTDIGRRRYAALTETAGRQVRQATDNLLAPLRVYA